MYKNDLALNELQCLTYNKTKPRYIRTYRTYTPII